MKLIVCISIFLVGAALGRLDRTFFKQNESFCIHHIQPNWGKCPQIQTKPPHDLLDIFNQPFTYLSKGVQCFIFESLDQKWVLKFIRLPRSARLIDFHKKSPENHKLDRLFRNFASSYENLSEETATLYAHLEPTSFLKTEVELIDPFQNHYKVDLDSLPFALQKKGELFFDVFDTQNIIEAKKIIQQVVNLYTTLYQKGYIDNDTCFDTNFGICSGKPFLLDVGYVEKRTNNLILSAYLKVMTKSLCFKLEKDSPELLAYYKKLLQ